jgi:hypothetical protein
MRSPNEEAPVKRMKSAIAIAVTLVATVAGSVTNVTGQTPAPTDQTTRAEVNAFMDQYWELFSAGKIDELVERIYHPSGQLSNQGHASIEELKKRFPDSRKALLAAGYGRSQMPVRNVCVVSPTVAVVSGRGLRYLTDGKVMAEFGWTYTLLKGATGWRMVAIFTHDPNKALTCSS